MVGNTGFEVDQADVPGLFEPFRRGGRERTGARGSGLGLSIVRAVCDAHGGTVRVVAQPGGGLEVTVTLPSVDAPALHRRRLSRGARFERGCAAASGRWQDRWVSSESEGGCVDVHQSWLRTPGLRRLTPGGGASHPKME